MRFRLKLKIDKYVLKQLSFIPDAMFESATTTFADFSIGGGQYVRAIEQKLREHGHSDKNIAGRVFGFEDREQYLNFAHNTGYKVNGKHYKLVGTYAVKTLDEIEKEIKMKFDVIVGNPPYQPDRSKKVKAGKGDSTSIWPLFIKISLKYLSDGGYLALIHPGSWRKPEAEMWSILTQYQILWLEMHRAIQGCGPENYNQRARETGTKVFGVGTGFDAYVLHKVSCTKATLVNDFAGNDYKIDLSKLPWFAGSEFDLIEKIMAKEDEEKCEITANYSYGVSIPTPWMNKKQTSKFKYQCISNMTSDGSISGSHWSSRTDRGHFGEQKVCFTFNGHIYPIADYTGKYGMTQSGIMIKTFSKKETDLVVRALKTETFKRIVWATKWSNFLTEWKMFTFFKKNWYEIILEEDAKLQSSKKNAK